MIARFWKGRATPFWRYEALLGDSIPPLQFSPSIKADLRANREPLAHDRWVSASKPRKRMTH
jgi:hypothetical protein